MTRFRIIILALAALLGGIASPARADEGTVTIQVFKAGWVVGGSFGSGVLNFRGEMYGLSVGGLSYGLTFGGSQTTLHGRVRNIRRASDIEGEGERSEEHTSELQSLAYLVCRLLLE